MSKAGTHQAEAWYRRAEDKAAQYFSRLRVQVEEKTFIPALIEDFQKWKRKHVRTGSMLSFFSRVKKQPDSTDFHRYITWLNYTGKLDSYLERSISYIYLRDLGKDLNSDRTKVKVNRFIDDMKKLLIDPSEAKKGRQPEFISLAAFYRWAQKEGVENAAIWVINKIKGVSPRIPKEMNAEEAERKLIKIIVGVVMHALDEMDEVKIPPEERSRRLDEAIRLGYFYGLTYPFIDDLLDSGALLDEDKERYSAILRTTLSSGVVPELGEWTGNNPELVRFVHAELGEAYEYIKNYQRQETRDIFYEHSYVFFHSQDVDRLKDLTEPGYSNEDLYLPIIIKAASSRLIVRSVLSAPKDEGFDQRVFYYGLYNQLADDFADMFDDLRDGAVTPYTYYLTYRHERPDLINPFELYWTVISHLIHHVYQSDPLTCEVILDRAINGLKRYQKRVGQKKYNEIMEIFAAGMPELNRLVQFMVRKAEDVDFFDKLLRDQLLLTMRTSNREKEDFHTTIQTARRQINEWLKIPKPESLADANGLLIDTANYSLEGSGKRIRPVLSWVMGVKEYGLDASALTPLFRALEYMHTASLIFDDLPSQDNSTTRRGRPTLHQVHNSAIAELTGIYLIQKAIEEQASLEGFDHKTVLRLLRYLSRKAGEICMGQAMDLNSKGKVLALEELNTLCFYKTGIAFEVSLVAPAMLAQVKEPEIALLKKVAYHAGISFQIKDDLLDGEGDLELLGKPTGKDVENNNSTFVTILGRDGASQAMWEHYCLAMEAVKELPLKTGFLKHLLNYIIVRDN
ncbi:MULTISPECIES: polyprenyl synthetase family protein [Paenibacillus]|uniref:polyprenyl synthetase family protein n=1 Tax=Paenibacillus TaxID=44249 RepID=UPI002FE3A4F8